MAVMLRNGAELNLKWTFTISLLFHVFLIFTLFSYNLFNRSSPFQGRYTPLSVVQVSLVDSPKGGVSEVNSEQSAGGKQTLEVRSQKQETKSQKSEARSQKQEVRSKKSEIKNFKSDSDVKSGTIPSSEIKRPGSQNQDIARQGSGKGSESASGQSNETTGTRDANLATHSSQTGGPAIDVSDFKYDYYLGLIRNKVDSRWNQPVSYTKAKKAVVEFTIRRNGTIENIKVAESSGDTYFDQTAVRAVSVSNPFPQLPKSYKENFLKVRYKFIFGNNG